MINIRRCVFETNSSSQHSLAIAPKAYTEIYGYMNNEIPEHMISNGVLYLGKYGGLYYGRAPFQILYTFVDKLRYAYACSEYDKDFRDEVIALIKKLNPEITRVSTFEYKFEEDRYLEWKREGEPTEDYWYVKEPSVGTDEECLQGWMKQYNFTLEDFITNPHYVVIVDGDEYCIWKDMIKLGLANANVCKE
jgi:hypothetical protein